MRRDQVHRPVAKLCSIVVITVLAATSTAQGEDVSALVGAYTENQPCKAGDPEPGVSRVRITPTEIDSVFGLCKILQTKKEGNTYAMHVECPGPGGSQMLGDVTFTPRKDKTIDFSDQDQTYKAVLHKCP